MRESSTGLGRCVQLLLFQQSWFNRQQNITQTNSEFCCLLCSKFYHQLSLVFFIYYETPTSSGRGEFVQNILDYTYIIRAGSEGIGATFAVNCNMRHRWTHNLNLKAQNMNSYILKLLQYFFLKLVSGKHKLSAPKSSCVFHLSLSRLSALSELRSFQRDVGLFCFINIAISATLPLTHTLSHT